MQEKESLMDFDRKKHPWIKEEISETLLLTPESPRVIHIQNLISDLRKQNPNFSIEDITAIMKKNNMHPELIRLVIWQDNNLSREDDNINKLINYLISQNPELTKKEIRKRMDEIDNYYENKNRWLF